MTRAETLKALTTDNAGFDVVVIGGGITGAGVAREAAGSGLRTLLVEQKDFSWGTSSRSSKMVHGGLRYLGSGHYGLTRDAVRERERLMAEAPGLIGPLRFIMPHFKGQFPGPRLFQLLLRAYDFIAHSPSRHFLSPAQSALWVPGLTTENLAGASGFTDAVTDDSRLVQRLIAEARRDGAICLNYTRAQEIKRSQGKVSGLVIQPEEEDTPIEVSTALVINATGAWADRLQTGGNATKAMTIRPLRGSHLVLPWSCLPVSCSVSLFHPQDRRPVFAFPWQGTTVLGTTDLDHEGCLDQEPVISEAETEYLLQIASRLFPGIPISRSNILSTWAGVRPVVTDGTGKAPSKENREHSVRQDQGLISIAGGKLTTFRVIAREALKMGLGERAGSLLRPDSLAVFQTAPTGVRPEQVRHQTWQRLQGYYGPDLNQLVASGPMEPVAPDHHWDLLWAELLWACEAEDVRHLDDLLLRRTRLGLILPEGGKALLQAIKRRCQAALGWDDRHWAEEETRYFGIYRSAYSLPRKESPNAS
ncbi:glycerol-3-phosphate dehydrogenase/oxidase [Marinobacter sp. SS8-8]|uniref:glycerol-3-phosphate dehydrogenase/oxidase n=1 Tax=Marinobacter sp. SS8-8 TaxID=3050452 RepID=UPI0026DFCD3F|nr:glycerol-3-phosphate dehydrogenase/oxidase [Marinobacter sp. SS8-8]|tara:strand:- start:49976 stop:51574 length:1599 start_codon:yes stop_codon:yes gene_type:complete